MRTQSSEVLPYHFELASVANYSIAIMKIVAVNQKQTLGNRQATESLRSTSWSKSTICSAMLRSIQCH